MQCDFFGCSFLGWILDVFWEVNFRIEGEFFGGLFCWRKRKIKKFDKNSGPWRGAMWIFWPDFWVEFWNRSLGNGVHKMASAIDVRIDDVGSILTCRIVDFYGRSFFAYSWKLPAYSGAFLLTIDSLTVLALWLTVGAFFAYSFSFFTCSGSFFAYSGKVRLIRALRTVSQEA